MLKNIKKGVGKIYFGTEFASYWVTVHPSIYLTFSGHGPSLRGGLFILKRFVTQYLPDFP